MSIAGIASSLINNFTPAASLRQVSPKSQMSQDFKQLGQDLQSGNLPAAQSDILTLQQALPNVAPTTSSATSGSISQAISQISQDITSGNLTAAQKDYTTIQQNFQDQLGTSKLSGHHHHHSGETNPISQLMSQLGDDLQAGNLASAKQAYASIQSDFSQFSGVSYAGSGTSSGISFTA